MKRKYFITIAYIVVIVSMTVWFIGMCAIIDHLIK